MYVIVAVGYGISWFTWINGITKAHTKLHLNKNCPRNAWYISVSRSTFDAELLAAFCWSVCFCERRHPPCKMTCINIACLFAYLLRSCICLFCCVYGFFLLLLPLLSCGLFCSPGRYFPERFRLLSVKRYLKLVLKSRTHCFHFSFLFVHFVVVVACRICWHFFLFDFWVEM